MDNPTLSTLALDFSERFGVEIAPSEVRDAANERGIEIRDGRVTLRDSGDKADVYFQVGYNREILEPPTDA